jgi:feruloyl-CoA synthase
VRSFSTLKEMFEDTVSRAAKTTFLRERTVAGWRDVTYETALQESRRAGAFLLQCGLSEERPLVILSQNSIDHALVSLGAMIVGVPVAPISAAYSRFGDQARLRDIFAMLTPGMVFAENGAEFAASLALAEGLGIPTLVSGDPRPGSGDRLWHDCLHEGLEAAFAPELPVTGATIAKVLLTSGSTGTPKGVIVTNEMMCADQDGITQVWTFLEREPPIAVDWLPWSHIFGGTMIVNLILRHAGTLVIDEGRPNPNQIGATLCNLRETRPTMHFGVPLSHRELVNALERDDDLAKAFFDRLRIVFTAGSALPADVWNRLHALADDYGSDDFRICVGWGATETAPVVTLTPQENRRPDSIGLPIPGAEVRLAPNGDKLELLVKGPMVTPGYWRNPDVTRQAFDADGYYRIGDAGRLFEDGDASKGILFDGRVAENFKLSSGTWVSVGAMVLAVIEASSGLIQDVAITGHDRHEIGLLVFPNLAACRRLTGMADAGPGELVRHPKVRNAIGGVLAKVSAGRSSSLRVSRALILDEPPSVERGEMTDKGYLNQRAVLRARANLIEHLYADPCSPDVVLEPVNI